MSYNRTPLSQLIDDTRLDIEAELDGGDARLRHRALDVLARVCAKGFDDLNAFAAYISRQILPDTAERDVLARHASLKSLDRKAAVAASGEVQFSGTDGTIIPAGTMLTRGGGAQYFTLAEVTLAGGATVQVEAEEAGPDFNVVTGQALTLVQLIPGVQAQAVVLAPGIGGGADEEGDESLLLRLLKRIREPAQGGAKSDYEQWALAQPGVTRAWPLPAWMGLGTVGLTFVMDDRVNIIPLAGDVAAVQAAIDNLRPVTAEVIVFAPPTHDVVIQIQAAPASPAVQAAIRAEIDDLFRRDAEPGGTMRRSRISEAISIATGEDYHNLVAPVADDTAPAGAMPMPVVSFV